MLKVEEVELKVEVVVEKELVVVLRVLKVDVVVDKVEYVELVVLRVE